MTIKSVVNGVLETSTFTVPSGTLNDAYVGAVKNKTSSGFIVINFIPDPPTRTRCSIYLIIPPSLDGKNQITPSLFYSSLIYFPSNIYARPKTLIIDSNNMHLTIYYGTKSRLYKFTLSDDSTTIGLRYSSIQVAIDADVNKIFKDINNPQNQRVWFAGTGGQLYYSDNIAASTPTLTLFSLQFTASTAVQSKAVAYLGDTDIGNLWMFNQYSENTVTDKQSPFIIEPSVVVRNCARINGFNIDGAGVANTGVMPRQDVSDAFYTIQHNNIFNCRRYGILDRQYPGQRTYVYNSVLHDNGIAGIKIPTMGGGFTRVVYSSISNNQYGILSQPYIMDIGPHLSFSSIFNNSVAGAYYAKLGQQINKTNPIVSQIEQIIAWNNGVDLFISSNYTTASVVDYINQSIIGSYNVPSTKNVESTVYNIDPLLLPNGDYKDIAGGYAYDSFAKSLAAGPFLYTRSSSTTDTIDSTFDYRPVSIDTTWQASNFTSNTDSNGNYSESWDGLKRLINLKWDASSFSTAKEVAKYIDMMRAEDAVLKFGETTTGTGDDWVDQFPAAITIEECDDGIEFITKTGHPVCAKNQWAGYYLKVLEHYSTGYLYLLIESNTAGDGSSPVTFTVAYPSTGYFFIAEGTRIELAYLPVKIDKSAAFAVSKYGYVSTPDTGYSLTLREVDLDD
jgi:hypothetical protein